MYGSTQVIFVQTNGTSATFNDLVITNSALDGNGTGDGVFFDINDASEFHGVLIQNNTITDIGAQGIQLDSSALSIQSGIQILSNTISSTADGVELSSSSANTWNNVTLSGNTINASNTGIELNASQASAWKLAISNNNLSSGGSTAIAVLWNAATINSGLTITNNQLGYEIGLLANSYDINPLSTVLSNTYTSSQWFIQDNDPTLDNYINIRSGVTGTALNTFNETPYIAFSDAGSPTGIRPGDQFHMWNETRFFGFLAELTTNDNAQFHIGVNGPLAQENNEIRLQNADQGRGSATGQLTYRYYSVGTGSAWNGKTHPASEADFDLLGVSVGTLLFTGVADAVHQEEYTSTVGTAPNLLNWISFTALGTIIGETTQDENFAIQLNGFFIPQETGTYTFALSGDDAVDLIINGTNVVNEYDAHAVPALGSVVGTIDLIRGQAYTIQIRQQETSGGEGLRLFWRRPSQINSSIWYQYKNELASEDYEPEVRFDISNIDITTSGLRIYSDVLNASGSGLERASLRNIVQSGVTAQSGVILTINAPGVTIEHMSFEHGHNVSIPNNPNDLQGVITIRRSQATLSGLSFGSNVQQNVGAIVINNNTASVNDVVLRSIEIGSGTTNGSYGIGIFIIALDNANTVSGVTISSGIITDTIIGVYVYASGLNNLSNVLVQNTTLVDNSGAVAVQYLNQNIQNAVRLENNLFTNNVEHVLTEGNPFASLRNDVLIGQGNTFGPAVGVDAYVFDALIYDNTITSAQQNFINVEQLEAYESLQDAIDDANENETIKIRSNAVFSGVQLRTNGESVDVDVSGLTITSVNPANIPTLRDDRQTDDALLNLMASGITIEALALTRSSGVATASGQGVLQINAPFATLSGLIVTNISESQDPSTVFNGIGYTNTGFVVTSGLQLINITYSGIFASLVEFVNVFDDGIIDAQITNNTASGITILNKDASSTSGIINMIAFNDILVRLDAFDTVVLSGNTFDDETINKTLIPIVDRSSLDAVATTVTTASGLTSGLYTTATWALVETALALPERTNTDNQTKLADLTAALSGLVLQTSFDALEAEVNFSSGLLESDFTNSTFVNFSGVFATSSGILNTHALTSVTNSGVLDATSGLINAMIQLEFDSEATLSGLVNVTSSGLDISNFTDPAGFVTARASGIELLEQIRTSGVKAFYEGAFVVSDSVVSGLSTELQARLDALVFNNFSGLLDEINLVSGLVESNFEADEWPAFDIARESGLTIKTNITNSGALAFFDSVALTSGAIQDVTSAMQTARANLVFSGFEVLSGLVNVTTSGLIEANYTVVTWNPFDVARDSGLAIVEAVRSSGALAVFETSPLSSGVITFITTELTSRFNALDFDGLEELSGLVNITTSGLVESDHTTDTWLIFNATRTSGIGILDAVRTSGAVAVFDGSPVTTSVINTASSNLQAAFSGLVLQASFAALETEINFSSGLLQSDFTTDSYNAFIAVFNTSSGILNTHALTSVTNSGVLDATTVLINAMRQLEFISEVTLSGIVNETVVLDASNFNTPTAFVITRSSGVELLAQIRTSGVKAFYENDFVRLNEIVSGLASLLQTEVSGLTFIGIPADLSGFNVVLNLDETNFEANEWTAFDVARSSGAAILSAIDSSGAFATFDGVALTSGVINNVISNIETTRDALIFKGITSLNELVNVTTSGLDVFNFTVETRTPFNIARNSGIAIVRDVASDGATTIFDGVALTSGVIAQTQQDLQSAFDNLVFQGQVSLSGLVNVTTSGLDQTNYTVATWTPFNTARTSGINILNAITASGAVAQVDGVDVSSGMISAVDAALSSAFGNLVFEGQVTLSDLVAQVIPLDSSNFTDSSSFDAARTSGIAIIDAITTSGAVARFDNIQLTSGVITSVTQSLNDATSGLVFVGFETLSGFVNGLTSGIDLSNFTSASLATFNTARTSGLNLYNNIVASGAFAEVDGTLVTRTLVDTTHATLFNAFTALVFENEVALGIVVNESSGLEESNFTTTSWTTFINTFNTASGTIVLINNSVEAALNSNVTSGVIETQRIDLITARSGLVFQEYVDLVTAVEITTSGLELSNFENGSAFEAAQSSGVDIIQVVTDAGALAVFESVSLTSGAIRVVIDALETAFNGLVFFNFNTLETSLELYSGLNEFDFTSATWSTFDEARNSGLIVLAEVTNSGVRAEFNGTLLTSGVIKDILDANVNAGSGLVFSGVEQLIDSIQITSGIEVDSGLYTLQSYEDFEQAYNSGVAILSSIATSGAIGEFEATRITSAIIVATADRIKLTSGSLILEDLYQAYVVVYNVSESVVEVDFTAQSYAVYSGILASGVIDFSIDYDSVFTQPQSNVDVINATTAVQSGLLELQLSGLTTLSDLIDLTSGLDAAEYTSASLSVLQMAIDSGVLVRDEILSSGALGRYEGTFITSGLLNQRIAELDAAYKNLDFNDFDGLVAVINVTSGFVANSGIYTSETFDSFFEAYNSGLSIQHAVINSGIFGEFDGSVILNTLILSVTNAIIDTSGALEYQLLQTNLTLFLDASNTLSYSGVGNVWVDLSASGLDVTLSGVGYSSTFSGIMIFDGQAEAATANNVPVPEDLTIDVWFNTQGNVLGKLIGFEGDNGWDRYLSFNSSGTLVWGVWHSGVHIQATSSTVVNDQQWQHVIATYDSQRNELKLYLNGILEDTVSAPVDHGTFDYTNATGAWVIGSGLSLANNNEVRDGAFIGDIAEIRIYNNVLTAIQVTQNYNATKERFTQMD